MHKVYSKSEALFNT